MLWLLKEAARIGVHSNRFPTEVIWGHTSDTQGSQMTEIILLAIKL